MAMRPCLGCGTPSRLERCPRCAAGRYGRQHRAARQAWAPAVAAGVVACTRCHELIQPHDVWHLDHAGERYAPAHAACNIGASD